MNVFGDAEFVLWKDDDDVDSVGSGVEHVIARKQKQQIEDSIRTIRKKQERGDDLGRLRFGYKYNSKKTRQIPELPDFDRALRVLALLDDTSWTWADIEEETGVNQGTISSIRDRRELIRERVDKPANPLAAKIRE